jgi:hypothetical protein
MRVFHICGHSSHLQGTGVETWTTISKIVAEHGHLPNRSEIRKSFVNVPDLLNLVGFLNIGRDADLSHMEVDFSVVGTGASARSFTPMRTPTSSPGTSAILLEAWPVLAATAAFSVVAGVLLY